MDIEELKQAVELAHETKFIMIGTSNMEGKPHVGAAGKLVELQSGGHINIEEFFCPATISNLKENNKISVVIWDQEQDHGYQLLGELCEPIQETMMLNGYKPENDTEMPQQKVKLHVHVNEIMNFSIAPHTDKAL